MTDLVSYSLIGWITDRNLKIIFGSLIIIILITAVAIGVDFLIRKTLLSYVNHSLAKSRYLFLRLFVEYHVLNSAALLIFGLVFVFGSFLLVDNNNPLSLSIATVVLKSANLFNLYILTLSINRIIFALHDYYQQVSKRDDKSTWHSYIKIFSFFTWLLVTILAIAYIFGQSPTTILTGLGALSAIVLLIFRDTFLGIVASIQANASSMVRVGDWITIDKLDIDGVIEDISINIVRIRNSDNTISTTPTHNLTSYTVKNWEYMFNSGGRKFKQIIFISTESIKFNESTTDTNLGSYRKHINEYLKNNQALNHEFKYQIILKGVTSFGVELEISAFTKATSGIKHEEVKAQITAYSLASLAQFQLKPAKAEN
ncbi:mechanosensitive ion channel family protein [Aquella oligotrophica]|uniref:Mechanosensitive ion channel MscS domain-containing protein n=1 Tax=Aquella oligotrophica TaxID=2067065 RepID=A0A2I7N5K4_9NEIS|nr:mechanosensitive ion channel domain-containing protein [Aquella oligotrophica]AUR51722.1 hypothetical protein CUN60_05235 [Aquella oligotrophica]